MKKYTLQQGIDRIFGLLPHQQEQAAQTRTDVRLYYEGMEYGVTLWEPYPPKCELSDKLSKMFQMTDHQIKETVNNGMVTYYFRKEYDQIRNFEYILIIKKLLDDKPIKRHVDRQMSENEVSTLSNDELAEYYAKCVEWEDRRRNNQAMKPDGAIECYDYSDIPKKFYKSLNISDFEYSKYCFIDNTYKVFTVFAIKAMIRHISGKQKAELEKDSKKTADAPTSLTNLVTSGYTDPIFEDVAQEVASTLIAYCNDKKAFYINDNPEYVNELSNGSLAQYYEDYTIYSTVKTTRIFDIEFSDNIWSSLYTAVNRALRAHRGTKVSQNSISLAEMLDNGIDLPDETDILDHIKKSTLPALLKTVKCFLKEEYYKKLTELMFFLYTTDGTVKDFCKDDKEYAQIKRIVLNCRKYVKISRKMQEFDEKYKYGLQLGKMTAELVELCGSNALFEKYYKRYHEGGIYRLDISC